MKLSRAVVAVVAIAVALLSTPVVARAFCGFYVAGADTSLYANATMVVMMREGQRTVLSMQNNYQGPPEDFAMIIPVPTVLQQDNVKTLPREAFVHVDKLASPRLVEYWEQDPCSPPVDMRRMAFPPSAAPTGMTYEGAGGHGVRIEAQFAVAEYDIVILSANDSNGLETWLRQQNYRIPSGASEVLRPYVAQGTKFFVAKVDAQRVTFQNGQAVLSPLRFYYDTPEFSLPVRLGLLNSRGAQDLIVHVLAPNGQRYEAANYANVTIPTNIVVRDETRQHFAGFYEALFKQVVEQNPRSVVTEYSWDAGSCDPCPTPPLEDSELATFGADVIPGGPNQSFALTRLHYRYERDQLGEDIVFRAASGIVGGRGMPDREGALSEKRAAPSPVNNFQGRYVILNRWTGAVACASPERGHWGGPPGSNPWSWQGGANPPTANSSETSLRGVAPATIRLSGAVAEAIPELNITPDSGGAAGSARPMPAGAHGGGGGCASCRAAPGRASATWMGLLASALAIGMVYRSRRSKR